ncbi:MAG TPA: hypothetical protein PK640_09930, partial [Verrucomicrobiota bacterium]|nr:hypothetical protein [Verrucomicrobiota bacterium]
VPALRLALTDTHPYVTHAASKALLKIAPEVLTAAPPPWAEWPFSVQSFSVPPDASPPEPPAELPVSVPLFSVPPDVPDDLE